MLQKLRTTELSKTIKELEKEAEIDHEKAFRITHNEFAFIHAKLASFARSETGLPLSQAKRRIRLTRGRKRIKVNRWKYVGLSTGGSSLIVHAGRLSPRKSKAGIEVKGRSYSNAFFWNPPGKKLTGEFQRVYKRFKSGKIRPIYGKNMIVPYRKYGPALLKSATDQILKRIKNEALLTGKKVK